MLEININLLFTVINLVVLLLLLRKFLIRPIVNVMEKREKLIADGLGNANTAQEKALQMKQQYETALSGAKEETAKIMEKAQVQAKAEYERIVTEAGEKAGNIMETAKNDIQLERERTTKALQAEIAGLAMTVAEKIIGKNTKNQGNEGIYNQFLEKVGDGHENTDN